MQVLAVRWRIAPAAVPRVLLHCPRCEHDRFFASSGRFRVNAQKKRLDAWLIYRCVACERTWNCPVFERQRVLAIDANVLQRLHANCPLLAQERATDLIALGRHVRDIELVPASVEKGLVAGTASAALLTIAVELSTTLRWRLDRLLAVELAQARSVVARWTAIGALRAKPAHRELLDGQVVTLALDCLATKEREAVLSCACQPPL